MINENLVSSRWTAMLFCVFWVRLVTGSDESLVVPIDIRQTGVFGLHLWPTPAGTSCRFTIA